MNKKRLEIGANILFWLLTAWLIINSFSIQSHEINIENGEQTYEIIRDHEIIAKLLVCILISVFLFYGNLKNVSNLLKGEKANLVFGRSFLFFIVALGLYDLIEYLSADSIRRVLPKSLSWGTITFYFTISIAYAIAKVWQRTESQRQQLTIEKKEAELSLLRARLHPHFLFNVLNNLLALVDQKENPTLAKSLDRLSGLLRYVVYDTEGSKVVVRKEIEFIRNFAELQSLRFEKEELDFDLSVIGSYDTQEIEPGVFIPFIENAFKYGVEPEKRSQVKVTFDLSEVTKINFSVRNSIYPTMQMQSGNGSGISSSKERLNLVYPNKHKLKIVEDQYYLIELEIETDESNYS